MDSQKTLEKGPAETSVSVEGWGQDTTVSVDMPYKLWAKAKILALAEERPVRYVLEEALKAYVLSEWPKYGALPEPPPPPPPMPVRKFRAGRG